MTAQASQFVAQIVRGGEPAPVDVSQFAMLAVTTDPPPNSKPQISQSAALLVTEGDMRRVSLQNPISLGCWQPCTSYGFQGIVIEIP